jgi:hypothetical protein
MKFPASRNFFINVAENENSRKLLQKIYQLTQHIIRGRKFGSEVFEFNVFNAFAEELRTLLIQRIEQHVKRKGSANIIF